MELRASPLFRILAVMLSMKIVFSMLCVAGLICTPLFRYRKWAQQAGVQCLNRYCAASEYWSQHELKKIVIPIPDISVQQVICAEATRRKKEADKLRTEAEREWQIAKEQFNQALLGWIPEAIKGNALRTDHDHVFAWIPLYEYRWESNKEE